MGLGPYGSIGGRWSGGRRELQWSGSQWEFRWCGGTVNLDLLALSHTHAPHQAEVTATPSGCLAEPRFLGSRLRGYFGYREPGEIPDTIGNRRVMEFLLMDGNSFQGSILAMFKNMAGLTVLNLTDNKLNGSIPDNFTTLTNLQELYLGHNNLFGTIPDLLVWAGFHHRKSKTVPKKDLPPQFAEIELSIVPYNDILKGTDGFSEANVLGKGRYGTVYKGTLEIQVIVVTVKVFNVQQSWSYKSFQAKCEALRRVRHRCLLKIITCCSSINHQSQDFRALVFEFMANGSLDGWIHPNLDGQNGHIALSLSQRMDIAVDIVDALDYLHNGCQPSIIHCDLKPSNILLNQEMRACVGDFGIARVLEETTSKQHINSSSTIGIRGSIGYIALEYGEGLVVSTSRDVFSLGITLIEMFTGKSPTDDIFRDGISLHYYAKAALPDKIMEIADSNISLHDGVNNSNDTRHITRTKECLLAVIQLGVLCSKQLPTEQLSMNDTGAEMHAIKDKYIFTQ
ncbi:probable LRR receptor-like serine/threonine-protein kinase At3g47570 [Miscanthus floridulus]|uniref:probable LRR receptor-like serine/threonine-protein kinase At3g47570 n=1 Tax=Miscanthus floridulus TaxID=154761 RepID=UPI00345B2AB6